MSAAQWPELNPSIDTLGVEAKVPEWVKDGCLGDERGAQGEPAENAARCVYGVENAAKTAIVLGDSIGISYVPAIRAALEPQGYKILVYTMQQCPSIDIAVLKGDKSEHPKCAPFRQWTIDQVNAMKPDLVITSNAPGTFDRLASGATGASAMAEWTAGTKKLAAVIGASAKRLVFLDPPPGGKSFVECATRVSVPSDCGTTINQRFIDMSLAGRAGLDSSVNKNVQFTATSGWFCAGNDCPAFAGTTPTYADGAHLTAAYSSSLGPVLAEALIGEQK